MRNWRRLPFTLFLLILWAVLRLADVKMTAGSLSGITFVILGFLVLIVEFFKSADIGVRTFRIEQAVTVLTTISATIGLTRIGFNDIHFGDVILGVVIVFDAWVSPVNSFSMALRNVQGNIGTDVNHDGQ